MTKTISLLLLRRCRYLHPLFFSANDMSELADQMNPTIEQDSHKQSQKNVFQSAYDSSGMLPTAAIASLTEEELRVLAREPPSVTAWFAYTDFDICSAYGTVCDVRPASRMNSSVSVALQEFTSRRYSTMKSNPYFSGRTIDGVQKVFYIGSGDNHSSRVHLHISSHADGTLAGNGYQHEVQSILAPFQVHTEILSLQHEKPSLMLGHRQVAAFFCGKVNIQNHNDVFLDIDSRAFKLSR